MRGRTLAESESAAPENGETVDGFDHAHDGLLQLLLRDEESAGRTFEAVDHPLLHECLKHLADGMFTCSNVLGNLSDAGPVTRFKLRRKKYDCLDGRLAGITQHRLPV